MKRKISLLVIVTMLLLALVGCGAQTGNEQGQGEDPGKETEEELKIVTTYLPATDLVLALQGKDNLVATDDKSVQSELLEKLEPKHDIVGIGSKKNGVNIEEIVGLEADLVVLFPTKDGDDTEKKLKDKGIEVVSINPENLESLKSDVLAVGKAMDKENLAVELNAYIDEKIELVGEKVADVEEQKSVYLAGSRGVLSTHSGDFYQHELITLAGGKDLSEELVGGWNEISAEQVIRWNPDVIVTVNYSPDNAENILGNKALNALEAIQNKHVHTIPSNIESWDMPKPSSVLGIMWMGKTLYPEKFEDLDLQEEADQLYSKFYGKSFTELGGKLGEEAQ